MKRHEMSLSIRSEDGRCNVDVGLDELSPLERKVIFRALQRTIQGGAVGFDFKQTSAHESVMTLTLTAPKAIENTVHRQISALNGST